jgi:hypothetical protein
MFGTGVLAFIAFTGFQAITGYDCVRCRTLRMEHRLFGFSWLTTRDTQFTEWYRIHGRPHRHQWERFNCLTGSRGCGVRHPVCERLPSVFQKEFAERSDAAMLANFFKAIASADREVQERAVDLALERRLLSR